MRVFHVLTHFLPSQIAGTELFVFALHSGLLELGYEGGVIIPDLQNQGDKEGFYQGVRVLKFRQRFEPIQNFISQPYKEDLDEFKEVLINERPDLLHFHEISGNRGVSMRHIEIASKLGIPFVITFHLVGYLCFSGTLIERNKTLCDGTIGITKCASCNLTHRRVSPVLAQPLLWFSLILRRCKVKLYGRLGRVGTAVSMAEQIGLHQTRLNRLQDLSEKIIVPTSWYREMLMKNGFLESKINVITHGVFSTGQRIQTIQPRNDNSLKLLFIGRVHWSKGLLVLLKALAEVSRQDIKLDIFGPHYNDGYYRECMDASALLVNVSWRGTIPAGETTSIMRHYDFLCVPSMVSETGPMVALEAFSVNLPVIGSNVYGLNGLLADEKFGFLFERGNHLQLADRLEHLDTGSKFMSSEIPIRSFKEVIRDHHELYRNLN